MFEENQLIREFGKVGFGEVWLAEKHSHFLVKKVALKLIVFALNLMENSEKISKGNCRLLFSRLRCMILILTTPEYTELPMPKFLLDIAYPPYENPIALGAAVGFFMIFMALSVVAFILLRNKVKYGSRLIVASILLLAAVIGSIITMLGVGLALTRPRPPRPYPNPYSSPVLTPTPPATSPPLRNSR